MTSVFAVIPLLADGPGESPFLTIVESAARAAAILVADAGSWWRVPSTSLLQPAVLGAHTALRPLLLLVLMVSVLVQAIRLILMRRSEPLLSVAGGLLRFAVAAALGITVLQGALWAGDLLATTLLGSGGTPAEGGEFGGLMRDALTSRRGGMAEPFLLLLVSVVVLLLAAAQWMAMALRQVALLVVAATLPLAAAGSLTAATRGWLSRMLPWALALVLYKPAAALVHAVGLQYLKQLSDGNPVSTALAGVVVLALGVAALPALLRLLSFTSVRIADGGWSGRPTPGAPAAVGAVRLSSRSSLSSSVQLAGYMENAGPGSAGRLANGASPVMSGKPAPLPSEAVEPRFTGPIPRIGEDLRGVG